MKARELIEIWRNEIDDTVEPFLWSDKEALEYLTDAQNEACRRARLLIDSVTAAICQYDVRAGVPWIDLDERVVFVRRAFIASRTPRLRRMSYRDLDALPGWESHTGTITGFVTDMGTGRLRLYRYPPPDVPAPVPPNLPTVVDTLNLTVVRLPLEPVNDPDDELELNPRVCRNLRHWMSYRGFLKRDEDTRKPELAAQALALFEREFGAASSAMDEEWIERTRDGEVEDVDGTF